VPGHYASRLRSLALAGVIAAGVVASPFAQVQARSAPESFAPLVEQVVDAVVNISAAQVTENRTVPLPQLPPGTPFEDFFNDFFNRGQPGQPGENRNGQRQRRSNSLGSGFVIDASGLIVTNNHVIGEANDITVNFNDGTKLKAEVVGKDAKIDIAVLRVKPEKPLRFVRFGDSAAARVGDWVVAIGNPYGFDSSVSAGIVSARNRRIGGQYDNYIQTDAAINRGNSGGPLFNMAGEVIGVNTAIISPTGGSIGIGFAVPAATAIPVIEQLRNYGETRRGWLGVRIQEVDESIAEALGLGRPRGALVAGVDEKGPAKPAGIETRDVILKFDGKEVRDSRDLPRLVAETQVGREVDVVVLRGGKEQVLKVTLGRLEDGERQASAASGPRPGQSGTDQGQMRRVLGMEVVALNADTRRRFSIRDGVTKGVVVTRVDPNSNAATKRLQAGDVIQEVGQEAVNTPAELAERVEKLKRENRRSALLLVANAQGELRFVAVTVE
jgi:serine protease Do